MDVRVTKCLLSSQRLQYKDTELSGWTFRLQTFNVAKVHNASITTIQNFQGGRPLYKLKVSARLSMQRYRNFRVEVLVTNLEFQGGRLRYKLRMFLTITMPTIRRPTIPNILKFQGGRSRYTYSMSLKSFTTPTLQIYRNFLKFQSGPSRYKLAVSLQLTLATLPVQRYRNSGWTFAIPNLYCSVVAVHNGHTERYLNFRVDVRVRITN